MGSIARPFRPGIAIDHKKGQHQNDLNEEKEKDRRENDNRECRQIALLEETPSPPKIGSGATRKIEHTIHHKKK